MAGRFEKPRNGRRADPAPRKPRQNPDYGTEPYGNDPYGNAGYGQQNYDGYENQSYDQQPYNPYDSQNYSEQNYAPQDYGRQNYGGYENSGYDPYSQNGGNRNPEKNGFGWGVLGFFIPLVGLILFLAWMRKKPRASKASGIGALVGFILQLLAVLGVVLGGTMYYNHMLDKVNVVEMTKPVYTQSTEVIPETTEETTEATTEETTVITEPPTAQREDYVNFLLVGQAARGGEEERFADTMLVVTLNKFDNSVTVTSLLRDSFVQPPPFRGHNFGHIKLTTVYHLGSHYDNGNVAGSMELMNMTLFENFGLEIDHNIEIDFDVFVQIIECLGGVDLEIDEAETKYLNKALANCDWTEYHFEPGWNHFDGYAALTYARMRKAEGDGESDIKRTARQRNLMETLMERAQRMSLGDLQELANQILPMITTNMSKEEMTGMLKTVLPMLSTMEFHMGGTCPASYSGSLVDIYKDGFKHSVLKFNPQETKKLMREITLGEIDGVPAGSK